MHKIVLIAFCLSCQTDYAQTYTGYTNPIPSAPKPATISQYGYSNTGQVKMGATASDIIHQVDPNAAYTNNATTNQQLTIKRIMEETSHTEAERRQKQLQELTREIDESFPKPAKKYDFTYFESKEFVEMTRPFHEALEKLTDMLSGKAPLSVKDAYYISESAYGNPYLTKGEFDNTINKSIDFIKLWMVQNGYDVKDNEAAQLAIQRFMSEKLTITKSKKNKDGNVNINSIEHLPLYYDYNDFKGEKDFRNYFITKCVATGSGQCNSMPGVYLCLAEGLKVDAYLSIAPFHALIKYPDKGGVIHNYEATTDWGINDRWYAEHFFMSPQALRTGIYLDTMNMQQVVANQLIDLACGYMNKFGIAEDKFPTECLKAALPFFPKLNNIQAYFLYSMILRGRLGRCLNDNGLSGLEGIKSSEQATAIYRELLGNEDYIKKLGYQDMPPNMYEQIMKNAEMKAKRQEKIGVSNKQKKNLFIQTRAQ